MEWISVKDRMPENKTSVIWCDLDGLRFLGELAEIDGMNVLMTDWGYGLLSDERVSHWMPLPEPPKPNL